VITVEVSPTIIEQINEEPKTYWLAGLKFRDNRPGNGTINVYTSERAAWVAREYWIGTGIFLPNLSAPAEIGDRQAATEFVKARGGHTVEVLDESFTVVDSWRVE
jgi:hypothetical protein